MNDLASTVSPAAVAAATASPSPAPAPAAAPQPTAAPAPAAAVEAPAAPANAQELAPVAATPPSEARPAHDYDTLLFEEGASTESPAPVKDAPKDPAQSEATPPESVEAPAQTAEPINYAFEYPESFDTSQLNQERVNEFTSVLGENRVSPEKAQRLMDMHLEEVQRTAIRELDRVWQVFHTEQKDWKDEIRSDPVLGGANLKQTVQAFDDFVRLYGGDAESQARLRNDLRRTGMGNNPALARAILNASGKLTKEATPVLASPPRGQTPNRQQRGLNRYSGSGTPGAS